MLNIIKMRNLLKKSSTFAPDKHFSNMTPEQKNKWSVIINAIITAVSIILNGLGFTIH